MNCRQSIPVFPLCAVTCTMAKANILECDGLESSFMIDPDIESKLFPDSSPTARPHPTASDKKSA